MAGGNDAACERLLVNISPLGGRLLWSPTGERALSIWPADAFLVVIAPVKYKAAKVRAKELSHSSVTA